MASKVGGMFVSLAASAARFKDDMTKARQAARKSAQGISNSFKKSKKASQGLMSSIGSLKGKLLAIAGPLALAATIRKSVIAFAEMERGLREVGTLMGGLTDAQMRAMGKELQNIAVRTGEAMDALTKAKYDIVSAGFSDAAESAKVLETAADLAVGSVTEVSTAADLLTTSLNAYRMTADDSVDISDKLFTIVRLGKTTMTELAGSMGRVLAIAGQAEVNLDEVGAAMATLTAQGQSTEEATTAVRASIVELLKPGSKLQRVIEDIGYESGVALIKEKGFAGSLKLVAEKAKETDTPMTDLFTNVRSMQAVLPLTGTAAELFSDNLKQMGDSAGATRGAFTEMESSVSLQMKRLDANVHNLFISLGQSLLPTVLKVTDAFLEFLDQPVSEQLREEQTEFNALMEILKDTNTEQDTRNKAIKELMDNYSGYIGNIDLETASYDDLAKAQRKSNEEFERKIRLAAAQEILKDKALELQAAEKKLFEETKKLKEMSGEYIMVLGEKIKRSDTYQARVTREKVNVENLRKEYQELIDALTEQGFIIGKNNELLDETEETNRKAAKAVAEYTEAVKEAGESQTEGERIQAEARKGITQEELLYRLDLFKMFADATMNLGNQFLNLRKAQIQSELEAEEDRERETFNLRKRGIIAQYTVAGKLTEAGIEKLDELEKGHHARMQNLRDQAVRDEKQAAKKLKPIKIAQAIANTALAVTKTFAKYGATPIGWAMAALMAAAGAVEIATIRAQPYKHGGIIGSPTLFSKDKGFGIAGEAGAEAILPLTRMSGGDLGVKAEVPPSVINFTQEIHFEGIADEDFVNDTVAPIIEKSAIKGLNKIVIWDKKLTGYVRAHRR